MKKITKLILVVGMVCTAIIVNAQNYAMSLPGGSDGSVSNVALPALNITALPITIEAWVYPIAKNDYGGVFYYRGATNGGIQFDKWTNPNTLRGIDSDGVNVVASNSINFNAWNHVAWVVTTTGMKLYLNGTETSATSSPVFMPFDSGLYLGWDSATADRTIEGYFDEVRIWTTERTAQDIQDNQNKILTGSESGLLGYWNFDDQAAGVATDLTSNGLDGTINGGSYIVSSLPLTLDIEETALTAKSEYSFYTNKNALHAVSHGSKNIDYKLYTINGLLVSEGKIGSNSVTNLGNYTTGVYIVHIDDNINVAQSVKVLVK